MGSISFRVLDANCSRDLDDWTACWNSWPNREVFAHPNYVKLFAKGESRALSAVLSSDGVTVLYPFILRGLTSASSWSPNMPLAADITNAYGYGGPFVWGGGPIQEITPSFWNSFDQWASSHNVVSEFIRLHLFPEMLLEYPGEVCERYPNVVRTLDLQEEDLWMDFKHKVRKNISKARRNGVSVQYDPAGDRVGEFLCVYEDTMRRCSAARDYFFSREFFESIHRDLAGQFSYFHALYRGQVISTELVLVSADNVYSFLGGTVAGAFDVRPNDMLKYEIIQWAKRNGKKRFVLGGGAKGEDGIYDYKLSFAPKGKVPFCTGQRVLREDLYAVLVENRRRILQSGGRDWDVEARFFPQYRVEESLEGERDADVPRTGEPVCAVSHVQIQSREPVACEPQGHRRIYLSPPGMSARERELLLEAFDSNWIAPLGPNVDAFEREFAEKVGVPYAVALASGTAGLHLALLALGVGHGDEVLCSTLTFAATANAITYVGARPVFIDSDRQSWNMDAELLAEELETRAKQSNLPKAVLPVDLYGQCADYERIVKICRFYDVPIIEDAAESLGATYHGRAAGSFGEIGVFSFNGNKIITTSGGGMLVTARKELAEHVRFLATQARDPAPHYEHSQIGYNYRMSNLLAAIGRGQLGALNERVEQRRANFDFYRQALADLPGIDFMPEIAGGRSTRWLTCITVDPDEFGATAEVIRLAHERENIESRPVWKPMHLQPVFADCSAVAGAVAEDLFNRGLCLPSGSNLSDHERQRVAHTIRLVHGRRATSVHRSSRARLPIVPVEGG